MTRRGNDAAGFDAFHVSYTPYYIYAREGGA